MEECVTPEPQECLAATEALEEADRTHLDRKPSDGHRSDSLSDSLSDEQKSQRSSLGHVGANAQGEGMAGADSGVEESDPGSDSQSATEDSQPPLVPGYTSGSCLNDPIPPRALEAPQNMRRQGTLKHQTLSRKSSLPNKALSSIQRNSRDQIEQESHGEITSESESAASEFASDSASGYAFESDSALSTNASRQCSSISTNAPQSRQTSGTNPHEPDSFLARRRAGKGKGQHELSPSPKQSQAIQTVLPSRLGKARPRPRYGFNQSVGMGWNRRNLTDGLSSGTSDLDESDSAPPSPSITSSRRSAASEDEDYRGSNRSARKVALAAKNAFEQLDDLTDRLARRHAENLRKFGDADGSAGSSPGSESEMDGSESASQSESASSNNEDEEALRRKSKGPSATGVVRSPSLSSLSDWQPGQRASARPLMMHQGLSASRRSRQLRRSGSFANRTFSPGRHSRQRAGPGLPSNSPQSAPAIENFPSQGSSTVDSDAEQAVNLPSA